MDKKSLKGKSHTHTQTLGIGHLEFRVVHFSLYYENILEYGKC